MVQYPVRGRSYQSAKTVTAVRTDNDQIRLFPLGRARDLHLGSSGHDNGPHTAGERLAFQQFAQALFRSLDQFIFRLVRRGASSYYQMAVQIAEAVKAGSNGAVIVTVEESWMLNFYRGTALCWGSTNLFCGRRTEEHI